MKNGRIAATYSDMNINRIGKDIGQMISSLKVMLDESRRKKKFITSFDKHEVMIIEYEHHFESEKSLSDHNDNTFDFLGVSPRED
jgi:hypothetical protein